MSAISVRSNEPGAASKGYSIFEGTMADMTFVQIEEAAKEKALVLLPVGVIEEHGPHLPLGVDAYGSHLIANMIKAELSKKGIQSLIAPPFYWGMNSGTASFAGSFTVREETMVNLLCDILASLRRWGFENVFIINHHYDEAHTRALRSALQKARLDTGVRAYWIIDDLLAKRFGYTGKESHLLIYKGFPIALSKFVEIHADSYETSFMMKYFPGLVDSQALRSLKSTDLTVQDLMNWRRGWDEARRITPQGFFGDPTLASPERGKALIEEFGKRGADLIEQFLQGKYQPPELK
jgi:creatinine amidohydrolase